MPCTRVGNAIVCTTKQRAKKCVGCGLHVRRYRLCDARIKGADGKTCDAAICSKCTTQPTPEKDLCPNYAAQWKARSSA